MKDLSNAKTKKQALDIIDKYHRAHVECK